MKTHAPIHPGEVLHGDFLLPLGLSGYRVAKDIGVLPRRINEIVLGKRAITPAMSIRFGVFSRSPMTVGAASRQNAISAHWKFRTSLRRTESDDRRLRGVTSDLP